MRMPPALVMTLALLIPVPSTACDAAEPMCGRWPCVVDHVAEGHRFAATTVHDGFLYGSVQVSNTTPRGLVKVSLSTGELERLSNGNFGEAHSLAVVGDHLFGLESDSITSMALSGGAATTAFAVPDMVPRITGNSRFLFWDVDAFPEETSTVMRGDPQSGMAVALAQFSGRVIYLAADEDNVYAGLQNGGQPATFTIQRIPVGGGPPEVAVTDRGCVQEIVVDATHIYWEEGCARRGSILKRAPLGGGEPTLLANDDVVFSLRLMGDTLIFGTQAASTFRLMQVPKSGGKTEVLYSAGSDRNCQQATGNCSISQHTVAVTADHAYWGYAQEDGLMRVTW